jgi:hypothetical protein
MLVLVQTTFVPRWFPGGLWLHLYESELAVLLPAPVVFTRDLLDYPLTCVIIQPSSSPGPIPLPLTRSTSVTK